MSQQFHTTQGIILRAIPFRDYDQILTLFTSDVGMIKILYNGIRSRKRGAMGCMPLTEVEVTYREKNGEIFSCHEMVLKNSFSFLRKEWLHLEVACDLLQVIAVSQLVGKAAPQLFNLLCFYLKKIPETLNPWILAISFRLKLLKHDGLAAFPLSCSECQQILQSVAFTRELEGWCIDHRPPGSQIWEKHELQQLYRLACCQNYREICLEDVSAELKNKVEYFFRICVKGDFA